MRTRTRDNVAKTVPIGMLAVAQHVVDFDLPAPYSIEAPRTCLGETAIRVPVPSTALHPWLDSITVDDEDSTASTTFPDYVRTTYEARLPNGVRIQVLCSHKAFALKAVPA